MAGQNSVKDSGTGFCDWFLQHVFRLRALPLDAASDEIVRELKKVDSRLAVELADLDAVRELVLTATGEPELFGLVRGIKAGLGSVPAWLFTALKPPRGFKFVLTTPEGGRLEASELFFEPLVTDQVPPALCIRIFVPADVAALDDAEWLLRVAVEAGIGEEVASYISFFEAAPDSTTPHDALPIEVLGDFVAHHLKLRRQ